MIFPTITFLILLFLKADGIITWHSLFILIPLFVIYFMYTAGLGLLVVKEGECDLFVLVFITGVVVSLTTVGLWYHHPLKSHSRIILLALKVEGNIIGYWTVLSIPFYVLSFLAIIGFCIWDIRQLRR